MVFWRGLGSKNRQGGDVRPATLWENAQVLSWAWVFRKLHVPFGYPQLLKVWNDHTLRYARTKGLRSTTEPFQTFPAKKFHMILDLLDPPILDFGFGGLDLGILEFGFWILEFWGLGFAILEFLILDLGILGFGFGSLDVGFWILEFVIWIWELWVWILDFRFCGLEFGMLILDLRVLVRFWWNSENQR